MTENTTAEKIEETTQETVEEVKVELPEPKKDAQGRSYSTGRRKKATARVWVMPGNGQITVNGKPCDQYFARATHVMVINQPFQATKREGQFNVVCTVNGSGLSGQAGAIKHGISRALTLFEPELRATLKKGGFLTRDDRSVERKKPGRPKARRKKQWAKR